MKNNKGFTYVELILVLAVMMLVASFTTITIGLVSRNNVSKAGDKLVSKISEARMVTIAKGVDKGTAIIKYENGRYYCSVDEQTYKVASDPISISIIKDDGDELNVSSLGSVEIKFNRSTGGLNSSNSEYDLLKIENVSSGKRVNYKFQKITGKLELQ